MNIKKTKRKFFVIQDQQKLLQAVHKNLCAFEDVFRLHTSTKTAFA